MSDVFSRRGFLGGVAAAGIGTLLDPRMMRLIAADGAAASFQPFRFVHMTDIHLQPERNAVAGFTKALAAVEALRPRPDFILTGGDLVFDVLDVTPQRAKMLFDLYKKVLADHTSLPVHNTIGNHDVFGWGKRKGVTRKTPGYGKELVKDELALKNTYYHFDHKGWRFFVLDNIQPPRPLERGYYGFCEPEQREWLAAELKKTRGPSVLCEHIPSVTVTPFVDERHRTDEKWQFGSSMICTDAPDRLRIIRDCNVKLWLSGHIHAVDRVELRGTTFICDGAVCGAWWNGPRDRMNEGFGVIDLQADGSVKHAYHEYGWNAVSPTSPAQSQPAVPATK